MGNLFSGLEAFHLENYQVLMYILMKVKKRIEC